ncbi:MAG TPA: sialidase family protein [Candidatus Thermoplasmatota archaeon]|nr:sialidase family protein [Candidatus Thermoplasmatota archaeon]
MLRLGALLLAVSTLAAGCITVPSATPAGTTLPAGASLASVEAIVHTAGEVTARIAPDVSAVARFIGHDAAEPTIAITSDGTMFYAAITFENDIAGQAFPLPRTDILRSKDGGLTWEDVTPYFPGGLVRMHPETGDPMVYVDPATDRVFDIDQRLGVTCYTVSFSDDGGESWLGSFPACDAPPADHQTIVAAAPRGLPASPLYPNFVFVCWNQIYATACVRSVDGGMTYQRTPPPFAGIVPGEQCIVGPIASALVGHLKASPDGVVYLPREHCGQPVVAVTANSGLSWEVVRVSERTAIGMDPAVAVDAEGNAYYVFQDGETSRLFLATSTDQGRTWSEAIDVSPPGITATHLPAIVAGDAGRVAIAWLGTDDPDGYERDVDADEADALWHGYISVLTDALAPSPTITTVRVNPADDPLVRGHCGPGRCPGNYDFIDIEIDAAGRPWAAFVDACTEACATGADRENNALEGFVATLRTGPGLRLANATLPALQG